MNVSVPVFVCVRTPAEPKSHQLLHVGIHDDRILCGRHLWTWVASAGNVAWALRSGEVCPACLKAADEALEHWTLAKASKENR